MREQKEDKLLEYEEKIRVTDKELYRIINEKYGVLVGTFHLFDRQHKNKILHELKEIEEVTTC